MELEALKEQLRNQGVGLDNYFKYPQDASPETINKVLSELSGDDKEITEDMNGCDMDWSCDFEFEGMEFHTWGSVYSGSFLIQKENN
jgi:hypothetical protein